MVVFFSPAIGKVYCYQCKLNNAAQAQITHGGFSVWKHASDRLSERERYKDHIDAAVTIACNANNSLNVDFHLTKQMEEVESYWRILLKLLVSVIKRAYVRGLALRGEHQLIESASNGNYL